MGILPRERHVFIMYQVWWPLVRFAGLSLLFGLCLALVADPFIAKANSPAVSGVVRTPKSAGESKTSSKTSSVPTKTTVPGTVAAAQPTNSKQQPRTCSKAHMLQPASIVLGGGGLVIVREDPQYYAVYGDSISGVRKELARCSPGKFFAYTSSRLSWKYNFMMVTGKCRITNVGVGIRTVVHYPEWQNKQAGSIADQQVWAQMVKNLVVHESGHVQRSVALATEMYATLNNMPAASCETISIKVKSIIAAYNARLRQIHADYDHQTNHGETQGAVL